MVLGVARRTLGILLLMLTVSLWTLSSFLASVSNPTRFESGEMHSKDANNILLHARQYLLIILTLNLTSLPT